MEQEQKPGIYELLVEIYRTLDFTKYNISIVAKSIVFAAVYSKLNISPDTCAIETEKIIEMFHKQAEARAAERKAEEAKEQAQKLAVNSALTNALEGVK